MFTFFYKNIVLHIMTEFNMRMHIPGTHSARYSLNKLLSPSYTFIKK